jgi:hypothetical protein
MEVFLVLSASGAAVRQALSDTDGLEIMNGSVVSQTSRTLKSLVR